jgi:hypothetical protein
VWQQVDLTEDLSVSLMISTDCAWQFLSSSHLQIVHLVLQMPITEGSNTVCVFLRVGRHIVK